LTYKELNSRANQLAHYLKKLGIGPEVLVGICLERSLEMVVGILGILKACGVYLPLDPAYPLERLAFMLEDAQVPVLLTQETLLEKLPTSKVTVLCLERDWEIIDEESEENLNSGARVDNLAYVIYTSGSTGRPKGVSLTHRTLSNLISWQIAGSSLSSETRTLRTLQLTPLIFDVALQEIFATWCSGGTLVALSEECRRDVRKLLRCITDKKIERLFLPYVSLQQLAEILTEPAVVTPTTLREIVTAGEQLQITQQIASLFLKLEGCALQNQYGPSESHVVTEFRLMGSPTGWLALPPIGRPIANTQLYILDGYLQPVPIGLPGQLYIGGVALARGYFNRPELTAENFIPHLFSNEPGARLYSTGDLACYLPDGNIQFLGRIDKQVKLRGFRIELGEIELVLKEHPMVQEAVVLDREDVPGDRRLVAYVIPRQEQETTSSELRSFLKDKLPEYMLPSAFVRLDTLPLTPTGKVNRRVLPPPEGERTELRAPFVAPRNSTEKLLAEIWAEVLGLKKVGIHDNFFELGGHSLLATQVISQVPRVFKIELPLLSLFESPTVAELSDTIEKFGDRGSSLPSPTLTIVPISRESHRVNLSSLDTNGGIVK
jgi:amino acid adenylation domain-containing protein